MPSDTAAARSPVSLPLLGGLVTMASALLLAINNITVPVAYAHGSNAPTVVLLRYFLLLGLLLVLLPLLGRRLRLSAAEHGHAFGAGSASAIGSLGLLGAFAFIPVSLAVLIIYLYPLFTALGQSLVERRWPSLLQLACLLAAFAGLAIAMEVSEASIDPRGVALALGGAMCFAVSFVWSRHGLARADNLVATFFMSVAGTVVTAAVVALVGSFAPPPLASATGWDGYCGRS